jgi:hypothetical protein
MAKKRLRQDDTLKSKVIAEIARELNLPEDMVYRSVQHFFLWQRNAFNDLNYTEYLWNYFGTFKIIPKRYDDWINSDKYKEEQNKLTNDKSKLDNNE